MKLLISFLLIIIFARSIPAMDGSEKSDGQDIAIVKNGSEKKPRKIKPSTAYAATSLMTRKGFVEPEEVEKPSCFFTDNVDHFDKNRHIAHLCSTLSIMVDAAIALERQSPVKGDDFEDYITVNFNDID